MFFPLPLKRYEPGANIRTIRVIIFVHYTRGRGTLQQSKPPLADWPHLSPPVGVAPGLVWLNLAIGQRQGGGGLVEIKDPPTNLGHGSFSSCRTRLPEIWVHPDRSFTRQLQPPLCNPQPNPHHIGSRHASQHRSPKLPRFFKLLSSRFLRSS